MNNSFSMKCVKSFEEKYYTVGEIYTVVDGVWADNTGNFFGSKGMALDIHDINDVCLFCARFELVEETENTKEKPLIEIVMEHLRVTEGEKFNIVSRDNDIVVNSPFVFENGILKNRNGSQCDGCLSRLITGIYKVSKLPWKPENGDPVWSIINDCNMCFVFYSTNSSSVALYKTGWLFKTKAEAEANKERVLKEMREVMGDE